MDSLFDRQNSGKNAIDKNSHDFTNDDFNKNSTYSKTFSIDFEEPTPHFEEPAHEVNRALSSESEGPTLILDQPAFSSASKGIKRHESKRERAVSIDGEASQVCYLYLHSNVWKIGNNYTAARSILFTAEGDFDNLSDVEWFEVLRGTKNSKKINSVSLKIENHTFMEELVFVQTDNLSENNLLLINGTYKIAPELDFSVWKKIPSFHLNGKLETKWKQEALVGWYDQIDETSIVSRVLTKQKNQQIYIYLLNRRWHIGPNPKSKVCWIFSAKTDKKCHEYIRWFEPVQQRSGSERWIRNKTITISAIK